MNTITRSHKKPIMHAIVKHGSTVYIGGVAADDFTQSIEGQTQQALDNLEARLIEAGTDRTKVLSTTVFLADMTLKSRMNEVWVPFFGEHMPTRATIGVADLGPGVLIEITTIAAQ